MEEKRKISKQAGIDKCVDFLYSGSKTSEIVQFFTTNYTLSRSAVDKWIRAAKPMVEKRLQEAEKIKQEEDKKAIQQLAEKLNITRERILSEYAKIGLHDPRLFFDENGALKDIQTIDENSAAAIAGIESYDERDKEGKVVGTVRKIKIAEKKGALDSICRVMGYNAPTQSNVQNLDENGKPVNPNPRFVFVLPPGLDHNLPSDTDGMDSNNAE